MEYNGKWQEVLDMEYLTTVEMSKKWLIPADARRKKEKTAE